MKFNIIISFSKIMSFYIFTTCAALSFEFKDITPIITALPFVAALIGAKQYLDNKKPKQDA
jgi:hypothetical protein